MRWRGCIIVMESGSIDRVVDATVTNQKVADQQDGRRFKPTPMNRFPHISLFVFLLFLVTSGSIAQSRTTIGIITTYTGIGSGIAANAPGCNRLNPCDTGYGFTGDGGPAISARLFDPY